MREPILKTFVGPNRKVQALGGLHMIRGNRKPYFSLTMASWRKADNGRWVEDGFGAAHEELVKLWPELKPLADLHLSDIDGVPMYAVANGLYYVQHMIPGCRSDYSFAKNHYGTPDRSDEECTQVMADHFRISLNEARGLVVALCAVAEGVSQYERVWGAGSQKQVLAALEAWVESQKPRWKAEAEACIKSLGLVVFGDRYEPEKQSA